MSFGHKHTFYFGGYLELWYEHINTYFIVCLLQELSMWNDHKIKFEILFAIWRS